MIKKRPELGRGGSSMERFWPRLLSRFAPTETERESTGDEFPLDVLYAKGDEDVEMASYYIRSRRFGRRLFGGLQPEEVRAFLDEVAEALQSAQRLQVETAARLQLLEDEVQTNAPSLKRPDDESADARPSNRLEVLRTTALQEVEALLHDARVRAKALTDAADERAAKILREAEVTAESIVMTARDQEASLRQEVDRLAESRLRMLDDVWGTLNVCQEWLATVDPRRQRSEERKGPLDRVA